MIPLSVEQLAELIGQTVKLRKIGKTRWRGLCPFKHENTPSFDVWQGGEGKGRFYCHGCHASGDSIDWLKRMAGNASPYRPDPELAKQRETERRRAQVCQLTLDAYPDLPPEAEAFLPEDPLTLLQLRLRRKLGSRS